MQTVRNIQTIYISPRGDYIQNALLKTWLYESENPFPSQVKAIDASSIIKLIIHRNQEAIIREANTGRLLMVVLRNRIGEDVLEHFNITIAEMFDFRRPVARQENESLNQGHLAAAGYLTTRQCGIFTHVLNLKEQYRGSDLQYQHEAKVVAANALLFNYAMGLFPTEVVNNIEEILEEYNLPRLDGYNYGTVNKGFTVSYMGKEIQLPFPLGLCQAYAAINYAKYNHIDHNILDFAFACITKRGIKNNNNPSIIEEGDFEGGNFFMSKWGIKIEMAANTLWCWPEKDEHGTTAIPSYGYQAGWSQNLAKRTVTAITKWREGTENPDHVKYRQNQIASDSYAAAALMTSLKKDDENEDEDEEDELEKEEIGESIRLTFNQRNWI